MSAGLTVGQLVELHTEALGLSWISGREGAAARGLDVPSDQDHPGRAVGHMNVVRANAVQVIGRAELDYLDALDPDAARATVDALFGAPSACVIVAGAEATGTLARAARRAGTPFLRADATSDRVVRDLRHFLARRLAPRKSLHGVFLDVLGLGVLLTGEPGMGKSELALELLSRGHRLIADDAPEFARVAPDTLEGICPPALRDFMEVRGLGIVNVREQFGDSAVRRRRNLRLIVRLESMDAEAFSPDERLDGIRRTREILGVEIPEVGLPVAAGRNLSVLVECTVRNQLLLSRGYDAARDLAERQNRLMHAPEEEA